MLLTNSCIEADCQSLALVLALNVRHPLVNKNNIQHLEGAAAVLPWGTVGPSL